jgi:predicted transposase YbfD/YdcC
MKAQFPNTNERKDLLYEIRKKIKNKRRWVVPVKRREDGAEARRCGDATNNKCLE